MVIEVSIDSLLGGHGGELLLVQGVGPHRSVLQLDFAALEVGHQRVGVLHEVFVVAVGEVVSGVSTPGLLAVEGGVDGLLGLH